MHYAFEDFILDTERCRLSRGPKVLPLRPKAYDLLRFLLDRPGRVASKDDLYFALWPDVTVDETSLAQCVATLHKSLGPGGSGLIRTVPKRGYMLDADVTRSTDQRNGNVGIRVRAVAAFIAAATALVGAFWHFAPQQEATPHMLFDTHLTAIGQPLVVGDTPVRVVASVKVLPPGAQSGWHQHDLPLFAYVLRGTIRVDYGAKGSRRYASGSAVSEAVRWPHNAINEGVETSEILVFEIVDGPAAAAPESDGEPQLP